MVNMGWWNKLVRNKKEAEVETKDSRTPEDVRQLKTDLINTEPRRW